MWGSVVSVASCSNQAAGSASYGAQRSWSSNLVNFQFWSSRHPLANRRAWRERESFIVVNILGGSGVFKVKNCATFGRNGARPRYLTLPLSL
jgi:hypothetical protein